MAKEKIHNLDSMLKTSGAGGVQMGEGTPAYDNQMQSLSKQVGQGVIYSTS